MLEIKAIRNGVDRMRYDIYVRGGERKRAKMRVRVRVRRVRMVMNGGRTRRASRVAGILPPDGV